MNLRARHVHLIEALTDNTIGYLINIGTTVVVFNWLLGYGVSVGDNLLAGVIFFVVALIRKYTLRRVFSNWIGRLYAQSPH